MIASDDWLLRYYQTEDGRVPFREWRDALRDRQAATAIRNRLYRLERGLFGDCKPVGDGVSEFRVDVGPGYRGYFFRSGRRVILLLCGGDKATQVDDIKLAKSYRRDYEQRTRRTLDPG
jgi:putative addiction module killer protein